MKYSNNDKTFFIVIKREKQNLNMFLTEFFLNVKLSISV